MSAAENGASIPRNVIIDDRLYEALRLMAFTERTSISEIVRESLRAHAPLWPYLEKSK